MRSRFLDLGLYLAAFLAIVDQTSKMWALGKIHDSGGLWRVSSFLNIRLNWNKGISFGILNDSNPWSPYILSAVALVILLLLLRWLRQAENLWAGLGIGFVMGGAVGNVIDRLRYGAVVDFIDLHAMGYHWYTFNLADSAILLGITLLLLENFAATRKKR